MKTTTTSKKIVTLIIFALTMTTCSSPALGQMLQENILVGTTSKNSVEISNDLKLLSVMQDQKIEQTRLEAAAELHKQATFNSALMKRAIKKLDKYVGKTSYVFSGSAPNGWDCSGLTMWFYDNLDIDLEHRATKQSLSGKSTSTPKLGDLVVFKYKGSKSAYHVGIYISKDLMLHAGGKKGDRTEYRAISSFGGNYSNVSYRILVETS